MKWLAVILFTLFSQTTLAEDRPWSKGVSAEAQKKAFDLFKEGNDEITKSLFPAAIRKYREALEFWDHPAIHFNIAKALRSIEKYLDAYRHFEFSMKHGGAPLDAEQVQQVKDLKTELYEKFLADLSVAVDVEGAVLSVNGEEVFKGPGTWQGLVQAGQVTILSTKNGYEPYQVQQTIPPGRKSDLVVNMVAIDLSNRFYREMAEWKPWVVVASGLVGLAGGGVLTWQSGQQFAAYDKAVTQCAEATPENVDVGVLPDAVATYRCVPTSEIKDKQSTGELFSTLSIASYAAGGATLAAGLVLLYINREKPITERSGDEPSSPSVTLLPVLNPGHGGINATIRF